MYRNEMYFTDNEIIRFFVACPERHYIIILNVETITITVQNINLKKPLDYYDRKNTENYILDGCYENTTENLLQLKCTDEKRPNDIIIKEYDLKKNSFIRQITLICKKEHYHMIVHDNKIYILMYKGKTPFVKVYNLKNYSYQYYYVSHPNMEYVRCRILVIIEEKCYLCSYVKINTDEFIIEHDIILNSSTCFRFKHKIELNIFEFCTNIGYKNGLFYMRFGNWFIEAQKEIYNPLSNS